MAQSANNSGTAIASGSDNYYQISDDDVDDCEELGDDCLLEEAEGPTTINGGRGPYERAWTTDATRALIHIRGPMEGRFTEGRQKRTALWLHCTRQLQRLGYRYSAAKVQKKWHNILITYNKNLSKKYMSGYVHWEFFEEMFKYLQGKKADCEMQQLQLQPNRPENDEQQHMPAELNCQYMSPNQALLQPQVQIDTKSNDEFDEDSTTMSEMKQPKLEFNAENAASLPMQLSHVNGFEHLNANAAEPLYSRRAAADTDVHVDWWKDYFERKLQMEQEKIQLQKDMHRDLMNFNKMSLVQQEKIERVKIDAINSLTCTLQKLVEARNRKA